MDSISQTLRDQVSDLLKPHRACLVTPVLLHQSNQSCGRSGSKFVVLSLWRGYVVTNKQPLKVESAFSYLEISSINIHSLTQIELETDRQSLSFSVLHDEDLVAMISHMTTSLKRIFPDSSPGKLLKRVPQDLQERLLTLTGIIEEQLNSQPGPCGGFSDTYAALCDWNEMPFREEIQWDVDNIYYIHNWRRFNLLDFSHLESRDLALAVAALSFNRWFTKIYCKELKLSADIQQQLTFLLSKSSSLEELSLEDCGLKVDFAMKMAAALQEHTSSALKALNLSGNSIEDKGVIALSQEIKHLNEGLRFLSLSRVSMSAKGLGCLGQVLSSCQQFSTSLTHLNLAGNPGSLVTEDATFLFKFLSGTNSLSHLDLSDTNCPLDTLFVSLSAGCCYKLTHLNLARNPFSHRKVREVTRSVQEFFSQSCELRYVGLSATKLPPQALRLLLQGLATNTHLFGLELDLSSCELCSAGAQVIQEHISEATAIRSLDISDNSFENDMVTLVLSVGRCQSLHHLALGRNFAMKSRALTDLLHRIAQLIQDEECPLQSLSVSDSKLKTGMHILLSALGGHTTLSELDISGNNIGDTGAKMLAKALMTNTMLRSLTWDRNNVTARGFQDVADALERNLTLQKMSPPLADITQSYRSNPEQTKEALNKIQQCLSRNNMRHPGSLEQQQVFRSQQSEKMIQGMCRQLEDTLQRVSHCNTQAVQNDIMAAHEVLQNARESLKLLPSLCDESRKCSSDGDWVMDILSDAASELTQEIKRDFQELGQDLMGYAETVCPRVVRRSSVCKSLEECVSKRSKQAEIFLRSTLVETAGQIISTRLSELRQTLGVTLVENIVEQILQDLTEAQDKMDSIISENPSSVQRINVPELRLTDSDFPTDDYSPAFWRSSLLSKSLRPAASIKSLLDADCDQHTRERRTERERGGAAREDDGGGRCALPQLPLSTSSPSLSPSTSLSPSPQLQRRRRLMEGEVASVDAAEAVSGDSGASLSPPPSRPPIYSIPYKAPKQEAAGGGGLNGRQARFPGCSPSTGPHPGSGFSVSPMEPLPSQGQTLRHYTAARPRPRRTHTQPPSSRPQEPVSEEKKEDNEAMGRVDEGVEEFFTKKIIPDYALKGRWEESNPAQILPTVPSSTYFSSPSDIPSSTTTPTTSPSATSTDTSLPSIDVRSLSSSTTFPSTTCSTTTTIPTKNIKKKFGDFFAFKRARAGRAAKTGSGDGGHGAEGVKVKRTSIADLIRPLREAKDRDRGRERDNEREKEREKESEEDANIYNDATTAEGTAAPGRYLADVVRETVTPAESLTTTQSSEMTPSYPTITTSPELTTSVLSEPEQAAVPAIPHFSTTPAFITTPPEPEAPSYVERRLRVTKRLRENKSQSLILLTGIEPDDKDNTPNKKHASDGTPGFEQRLQVMLHRMGVSKTPPAETKMCQVDRSKDEEMRKATSEGAILNKPELPPKDIKSRIMSTSSAESRHPLRVQDPNRPEPLYPKPSLPECIMGPLPPKPLSAKLPPPIPAARPSSAPAFTSSSEQVQLTAHTHDGRPMETEQNGSRDGLQGEIPPLSPRKELHSSAPKSRRGDGAPDRSEKVQSVTEESLPKVRQHLKPLPQRRAVSVHEEALTMTQELKAVLQKSPIRFRGNRWDLPSCKEDEAHACATESKPDDEKKVKSQMDEQEAERGQASCGDTVPPTKQLLSQEVEVPRCTSSDKTSPVIERPPVLPRKVEKLPVNLASERKSPTRISASSPLQEKVHNTLPVGSKSTEISRISPSSQKNRSVALDQGNNPQGKGEALSPQHTKMAEPAEHRTEPCLFD
ncbi:capping protein, Arp2/3 and myosin-I linker protein 2-like isoform X1 [Xiphophorus maculatus]|uniref:capping protein, Arp2/3 and myosin-I linker protein 2-like isoform X1 n=1 Tax=Xiphophorus maculatus TaxID=8083 RepID=UPI000C6DB9C3|nr:capping protein, Arp2/3 and myosin-I linker protein 2-like isoform X1 [Xiphophorus maculatus]